MTTPEQTPAPKKPAARKKSAVKKKAAARKKAVKKQPVAKKKSVARKKTAAATKPSASSETTIVARIDIGFGNQLFIRGEGGGLSWEKGVLMENEGSDEWSTPEADQGVVFKFLINDQIWSLGEDLTVAPGGHSVSTPNF